METIEELFRAGRYRHAASRCSEVLVDDPDNLGLHLLRVRALMALRCDEQAKRELGRLLRWRPDSGLAHRLLAELAIRLGKMTAAVTLLKRAVKLSPDDRTASSLLELIECLNRPGPDLDDDTTVVTDVRGDDFLVPERRRFWRTG